MEQKKILWIIISVAVFLCIVLAAGLLWLYPSKDVQTAAKVKTSAPGKADINFDPVEWVRDSRAYPGITSEKKTKKDNSNFTIVYGETDGKTGGKQISPAPVLPVSKAKPSVRESVPVPETRKQVVPAVKAVAKPVKEVVKQENITVREYWIQAGSFKRRTSAERAKALLAKEGFTSRITIKTMKGIDYYRVRIGPYAKKAEAEKFLEWVKKINMFKTSYISQVIAHH